MSLKDYAKRKPVIETKRLLLREMKKSDVESLMGWMPDKSIYELYILYLFLVLFYFYICNSIGFNIF